MRMLLIVLVALAGCAETDPYDRAGTWQPGGVNDRNLAAMVADPRDLLRGHGEAGAQPQLATTAVDHLLAGAPKPLPTLSSDTSVGGAASAAPTAAPAPATPGATN